MDRALYSRNETWVQDWLAMIVGRVVYAGSKLALSNQWKNTALWEMCGVHGPVEVEEHCYLPMDRLLERQRAIQRTLAGKHLKNGHLVFYDITSTYPEGAYPESQIVLFGYNRDGKKGHEQVVLGLLCGAEGCPVGVEVFAGNIRDASTVAAKIQELRREYGLKEVTFVGDRGMVTQANAEYKMGKFVEWQIRAGRLEWDFKQARIKQETLFDGCHIVSATVPRRRWSERIIT